MNLGVTFIWKQYSQVQIPPPPNFWRRRGFEPGTFWLLNRCLSQLIYWGLVEKLMVKEAIYVRKSSNPKKISPRSKVTRLIRLFILIWHWWLKDLNGQIGQKFMGGDAFKVTRLIRLTRKKFFFSIVFNSTMYVSCRINAIRLLAGKRLMLLLFIRVLEPGWAPIDFLSCSGSRKKLAFGQFCKKAWAAEKINRS